MACAPSGYQNIPQGCLDLGIQITPVKSEGTSPFPVTFHLSASPVSGDNEAIEWCMDFGDGSNRQSGTFTNGLATVSHTYVYNFDGTYQSKQFYPIVTVTTRAGGIWVSACGLASGACSPIDGGGGGSGDNCQPHNNWDYTPKFPQAGEIVHFAGHDSCAAPNFFTWYIEDANGNTIVTLGGTAVNYAFPADGMYKARLRTVAGSGAWYATWLWIQVGAGGANCQQYPKAYWEFSPANPAVGQEVIFTNKSECAANGASWQGATGNAYMWTLDDGVKTNSTNFAHIFNTAGMHHVVLRCENQYGWWEWWNDVPVGVSPSNIPQINGIGFIPGTVNPGIPFTARVTFTTGATVPTTDLWLELSINDTVIQTQIIHPVQIPLPNQAYDSDFVFENGLPDMETYNFCAKWV
jgi:PKD repeat protein